MTAYLLASVKVLDDSWIPDYAMNVHDIVHKHGGKYLCRSANISNVEGDPLDTTLIAIIEFPSKENAEAFVNDPEYAPYAKARQEGGVNHFNILDDTDVAGTIPYLNKA